MNLINIFCFIFLTTYARASSDETLTTSTDLTITSTDGITTDTTPYETTSYISDRFDESSTSDAAYTTGDSFSDSITSTTLSYDSISTIETQTTTETSTDVPEDQIPGIIDPSVIPRGNFGTDSTPKPLEPSSDGKGHELEIPEEKETDVGKKKIINTTNPSILRPEDSDKSGDFEISKGGNVDASNTEKNMKITDAGNGSETSKGNDNVVSSTEEKMINTKTGTESKVSKGKAAGILVASCILAVVIIWISKMVYTRYQSRTYDVRHGIEMRNP
ncbi:unnamed protein product, partial [Brenthis ino]